MIINHCFVDVRITGNNFNYLISKDQSRNAPSQWEMSLQCNDISQRLGTYLDWSLDQYIAEPWILVTGLWCTIVTCFYMLSIYYNDVKWALWYPKSLVTWMFVEQLVEAHIKETIKAPHYRPFCEGNPQNAKKWGKCFHVKTSGNNITTSMGQCKRDITPWR